VLDLIGGGTLERSWSIAKRGGIVVTTVGNISAEYGVRGISSIVNPSGRQLRDIS
jgi:hypothetical protein